MTKRFLSSSFLIITGLGTLGILGFNENSLKAEDYFVLEEIKVTAPVKREPLERISQEVKVIEEEVLKLGPEIYSGFELRERGVFGVQADLSIRGSTFEQNLVVFEGIRISDPQTGHHLMNLPFTGKEFSSIEILPGGASTLYGPGGFGGAVNFNLKKPKPGFEASFDYGSYDYRALEGRIGFALKNLPISVNFSQVRSNGYIWNKDFDLRTFNVFTKDEKKTFFYGFQEKDFGARNFYTTRWNTEWETTRTHLFLIKHGFYGSSWGFEPGLLYRIHYDTYLLDRRNPSFYKNTHKSQVFRINLPFKLETKLADHLAGMELSYEDLKSSRLGNHVRQGVGIYYFIYPNFYEKLFPSLGIRYDSISKSGPIFSYSLGLAYVVSKELKIRSSFGFSYRIPSFTELYYWSPDVVGNLSLSHEKAWNYEVGFDYKKKQFEASFTLFYRHGKDIIDWVKVGNLIQANNIETLDTVGFTLDGKVSLGRIKPFFSYTYLNLRAEKLPEARYYGNYQRHNFILGLIGTLPRDIEILGKLNFRKPFKKGEVCLIDLEVGKNLNKNIKLRGWVKNLLDENYEEIKGVKGIPQWFGVGFDARF